MASFIVSEGGMADEGMTLARRSDRRRYADAYRKTGGNEMLARAGIPFSIQNF
jgi:hypothetical protein